MKGFGDTVLCPSPSPVPTALLRHANDSGSSSLASLNPSTRQPSSPALAHSQKSKKGGAKPPATKKTEPDRTGFATGSLKDDFDFLALIDQVRRTAVATVG